MISRKFKCQLNHPMEAKVEGCTHNHVKRENFVHQVKKLEKEHLSHLPKQTIPPVLYHSTPWEETSLATMTICMKIPSPFIKRHGCR